MSQTQQQSICNRIQNRQISIFGHVRYLQGSVPAHEAVFFWLSTPVPVTDLMSDRSGNVHEVVPDIHGSASWRSMSGLLQMLLGTWQVIVTSGGCNDPSLVKRSSERVSFWRHSGRQHHLSLDDLSLCGAISRWNQNKCHASSEHTTAKLDYVKTTTVVWNNCVLRFICCGLVV